MELALITENSNALIPLNSLLGSLFCSASHLFRNRPTSSSYGQSEPLSRSFLPQNSRRPFLSVSSFPLPVGYGSCGRVIVSKPKSRAFSPEHTHNMSKCELPVAPDAASSAGERGNGLWVPWRKKSTMPVNIFQEVNSDPVSLTSMLNRIWIFFFLMWQEWPDQSSQIQAQKVKTKPQLVKPSQLAGKWVRAKLWQGCHFMDLDLTPVDLIYIFLFLFFVWTCKNKSWDTITVKQCFK